MDIYICEAHADVRWRMQANIDKNIIYKELTTDDERTEVAYQIGMNLKMP